MVGCATDPRTRRQASAVDCVRGRLSVLVSRVCVCHQPIPHDARECIVGLRSAAVTPIAPPSVVCRVSDVGARLRLVWAASAFYYCYCYWSDHRRIRPEAAARWPSFTAWPAAGASTLAAMSAVCAEAHLRSRPPTRAVRCQCALGTRTIPLGRVRHRTWAIIRPRQPCCGRRTPPKCFT